MRKRNGVVCPCVYAHACVYVCVVMLHVCVWGVTRQVWASQGLSKEEEWLGTLPHPRLLAT